MKYSFRDTTINASPCNRCKELWKKGLINLLTVMPVPESTPPIAHDGTGPCCIDCKAADSLISLGLVPSFIPARQAVSDDRHSSFLFPGFKKGLIHHGLVTPCQESDLDVHNAWLDKNGIGSEQEETPSNV